MKVDGACHCGHIKIECDADPDKTTICHCTDCQVGTGSAFRVSVPVAGATFQTDKVFVGVLVFALTGMIGTEAITRIERRFDKWRPKVGAAE